VSIRAAEIAYDVHHRAGAFGIRVGEVDVDFAAVRSTSTSRR